MIRVYKTGLAFTLLILWDMFLFYLMHTSDLVYLLIHVCLCIGTSSSEDNCHVRSKAIPNAQSRGCRSLLPVRLSTPSKGRQLPVSTPSKGRQLPVSTLSKGRQLPVSTSSKGRRQLPVSTPSKGRLLPVSTPSKGRQLPVSTPSKGRQLPASTSSEDYQLPVSTRSKVYQLPVTTRSKGRKTANSDHAVCDQEHTHPISDFISRRTRSKKPASYDS